MFYALFGQAKNYLQNVEVTTMKDVHVVFAMCGLKDLQIDRQREGDLILRNFYIPDKKVRICTYGQLDQRTNILQNLASFFMLSLKML